MWNYCSILYSVYCFTCHFSLFALNWFRRLLNLFGFWLSYSLTRDCLTPSQIVIPLLFVTLFFDVLRTHSVQYISLPLPLTPVFLFFLLILAVFHPSWIYLRSPFLQLRNSSPFSTAILLAWYTTTVPLHD